MIISVGASIVDIIQNDMIHNFKKWLIVAYIRMWFQKYVLIREEHIRMIDESLHVRYMFLDIQT